MADSDDEYALQLARELRQKRARREPVVSAAAAAAADYHLVQERSRDMSEMGVAVRQHSASADQDARKSSAAEAIHRLATRDAHHFARSDDRGAVSSELRLASAASRVVERDAERERRVARAERDASAHHGDEEVDRDAAEEAASKLVNAAARDKRASNASAAAATRDQAARDGSNDAVIAARHLENDAVFAARHLEHHARETDYSNAAARVQAAYDGSNDAVIAARDLEHHARETGYSVALNRVRAQVDELKARARAAAEGGNDSDLAKVMADSHDFGQQHGCVDELSSELHDAIGVRTTCQRTGHPEPRSGKYPKVLMCFYGIILAYAGFRTLDFVCGALNGPAPVTVVRARQNAPKMMMGTSRAAIAHNWDELVWPTLCLYGLEDCALLFGEDGTSTQRRIDIVNQQIDGNEVLMAYGLAGGPLEVASVRQLADALITQGFASTLYVCSIIPVVAGAPSLPLVIDAHANAFTSVDVHKTLMTVLSVLAERGLGGRLVGGVSDGDVRLRNMALMIGFHNGAIADEYLSIAHFLVPLTIPFIRNHGFYLQTLDFMHIIWRMRLYYLTDKRSLVFDRAPFGKPNLDELIRSGAVGDIPAKYLDSHNKQEWTGALCFAGVDADGNVVPGFLEALGSKAATAADAMYWKFVRYYIQIFIAAIPIRLKIRMAGYVLSYLLVWRRQIRLTPGATNKHAFLTEQTYMDIVISVVNFVLLVHLLSSRGEALCVGMLRLLAARLSSCYLEYLFAFCRSEHRNATSFGVWSGVNHVNSFHWITRLERELAKTGKADLLPGARSCKRTLVVETGMSSDVLCIAQGLARAVL